MSKSVIISCAITGGIHTPSMSPHLPITPDEIAQSAIDAANAGAAILHLHARDPADGRPDPTYERFMQFLPKIKQECDAIINITTGGAPTMSRAERLTAAKRLSPELASLNMGSLNFALFPLLEKPRNWQHDWEVAFLNATRDLVFRNTFEDIEFILKELGAGGTRFEFECYDVGHLHNLAFVVDQGWVKPPFFIQAVMGILGGIAADPDNLAHMQHMAQKLFGEDHEFSVLAAGRHQMGFATQNALKGGNLRVGLEDSLYISKGELAVSNAQQVSKIRTIIEELGLTVATPAEVRARLGLKGADQTGF